MSDTPAEPVYINHEADIPGTALMHCIAVLNGLGTLLLGPILPLLARHWHLDDAHAGRLLLAQFCGSFLGGVSTSHRLRRDLLQGLAAAAVGLCLFALAPSLAYGCAALVVSGFGIGRAITTVNILAGRRVRQHRGAALARLNLSWSLGALLSPLLAGWLTPHVALPRLLLVFGLLYLSTAAALLLQARGLRGEPEQTPTGDSGSSFPARLFACFSLLLFVYGGLETCLSGWLTTFALRFGHDSLVLSEYTTVLLLAGLTAGRAISAWLLLRVRDRTLTRLALVLSAAFATLLATSRQPGMIATVAVLLGFVLAPIFPAVFGLLLANAPPARKAGFALAASGLGAAALPWMLGLVSSRTGSLQTALAVPVGAALLMLALTYLPLTAPNPP